MKNTLRFSLRALCATLVCSPVARAQQAASSQPVSAHVMALAGYAPLKGQGIVVTMRDRQVPGAKISPKSPLPGLVHDYELLWVVNELRAAGAKGIAINGVRLTNQTAIRAVGPTIQVGGKTTGAPFRIEAVGSPGLLASGLNIKGGLIDQMRSQGPRINVSRASQVFLTAAPLLK